MANAGEIGATLHFYFVVFQTVARSFSIEFRVSKIQLQNDTTITLLHYQEFTVFTCESFDKLKAATCQLNIAMPAAKATSFASKWMAAELQPRWTTRSYQMLLYLTNCPALSREVPRKQNLFFLNSSEKLWWQQSKQLCHDDQLEISFSGCNVCSFNNKRVNT